MLSSSSHCELYNFSLTKEYSSFINPRPVGSSEGDDMKEEMEDLHWKLETLITWVSEHGWHAMDDHNISSYVGV